MAVIDKNVQNELIKLIESNEVSSLFKTVKKHNIAIGSYDVNEKNDSLLHIACQYAKIDIVKALIGKGAFINRSNTNKETPIFYSGDVEITRFLIEKGANIKHRNNHDALPLHSIVRFESTDLIDLHVENGASLIAFDAELETPFLKACRLSSSKVARHIAKACPESISFQNSDKESAIHIATRMERFNVVAFLLEPNILENLDINDVNRRSRTALHYCCVTQNMEICELLLKFDTLIKVNVIDENQQTPLDVLMDNVTDDTCYSLIEKFIFYGGNMFYIGENETVRFLRDQKQKENEEFTKLLCFALFMDNRTNIESVKTSLLNTVYIPYLNEMIALGKYINQNHRLNRARKYGNLDRYRIGRFSEEFHLYMLTEAFQVDYPKFGNFFAIKYGPIVREIYYWNIRFKIYSIPSVRGITKPHVHQILNFVNVTDVINFMKALDVPVTK